MCCCITCSAKSTASKGVWGHAVGGMGAITQAMAQEARGRGVEIDTDCEVARVCVDNRGALGVQLADGRVIEARCVVSNLNPKLLYLKLIDERELDADFVCSASATTNAARRPSA